MYLHVVEWKYIGINDSFALLCINLANTEKGLARTGHCREKLSLAVTIKEKLALTMQALKLRCSYLEKSVF